MADIAFCPAPEAVAVGSTIGEIVDHWGRVAPTAPAIAARNRKDMSYGELARLTDSIAAQLQHAGFGRDSRLAVVHRGGAEALATVLGVVKRSIAVPVSNEYSAHEPAALRYGAPQAVIDTIKFDREPKDLSPEETVIIKVGRQIMREHKLDSELYAEAVRLFGRKGFVELVTVMGDYVMVGMVLTAIDQHLPPNRPALLPPR